MYTYQSMLAVLTDEALMSSIDVAAKTVEIADTLYGSGASATLPLRRQYDMAVAELTRRCEVLGILNHSSPGF